MNLKDRNIMKLKLIMLTAVIAIMCVPNYSYAQTSFENERGNVVEADSTEPKKKKEIREKKKKKLDAMKKKFFNEKLSLSAAEQKKFWPIYNEYHKKQRKLNSDFRKKYKENDLIYMTNEEAEKYLSDFNKLKEDELKLMKEYQKKFKAILPVKKVIMIYKLEKEFHQKVIKTLYKKRGPKGGGGPGRSPR